MKNHTVKTTGAAKAAGNGTGDNGLLEAWMAHSSDPGNEQLRETLAVEVDAAVRRGHPRLRGEWLQCSEDDVLSRATTLLVDSYLAGNRALLHATLRGDRRRIGEELSRSLRGAVATAKRETLKPIRHHRRLVKKLEMAVLAASSSEFHPAQAREIRDLPAATQRQLLLDLIEEGVACEAITEEAGRLGRRVVEDEVNATEAGRTLGMSRRKAHARMKGVRRYLDRKLQKTEFPMM